MGIISEYSSMPNLLLSPIGIKNCDVDKYTSFNAIWDTGANNTLISSECVKLLMLKRVGQDLIKAYNGDTHLVSLYEISICFPQLNIGYPKIRVSDGIEKSGPFDIIIGLDIISQGDFRYYKKEEKYILDFDINIT